MKHSNLTFRYSFIQLFLWICAAPIMGYTSVFLLNKGFSNTAIGITSACGGLASALLQPLVASYADKEKSLSIRWIALIIVTVLFFSAGTILIFREEKIIMIVFFALLITLIQMMIPFANALAMESINAGKVLNFGATRGAGSLGYACVSILLGKLIDRFGVDILPLTVVLGSLPLFWSVFRFPFQKPVKHYEKFEAGHGAKGFFKTYPIFAFYLSGMYFSFMGHNMINIFAFQIISFKGGNETNMGIAIGLAAVSEIPIMLSFGYLLRKFKSGTLLQIGTFMMLVKSVATFFVHSMPAFYFIQLIQAFGFAFFIVAQSYYVNEVMGDLDKIKGQAFITTAGTVSVVSTFLIGGRILDVFGTAILMLVGMTAAALGFVIISISGKKLEAEKKKENSN